MPRAGNQRRRSAAPARGRLRGPSLRSRVAGAPAEVPRRQGRPVRDFEAWHSNLQGLVDFMRMLAETPALPWCLLLSGDVHYGCNVQAAFSSGGHNLPLVQLVSSSFKHSGTVSRTALELLGRIVSRRHERVGWDRPPKIRRRLVSRVAAKAANTDA